MNNVDENNQCQWHQTINQRNEILTLRHLYAINSSSNFTENLCLHFYQQLVTVFCEVLRRTILLSQAPILSEFNLHFLPVGFLSDFAEKHDLLA